jgi:hypothetical protein
MDCTFYYLGHSTKWLFILAMKGMIDIPWTCFIVKKRSEAKEIKAMWPEHNVRDSKTDWYVRLPNGTPHNIHSMSSDGTCWDVTGQAPNFTVSPSIN